MLSIGNEGGSCSVSDIVSEVDRALACSTNKNQIAKWYTNTKGGTLLHSVIVKSSLAIGVLLEDSDAGDRIGSELKST